MKERTRLKEGSEKSDGLEDGSTSSLEVEDVNDPTPKGAENEANGIDVEEEDANVKGQSSGGEDSQSNDGGDDDDDDANDEEHSDGDSVGNNATKNDAAIETSKNEHYAEQCTFDLSNLMAFNTHQVNSAVLYSNKAKQKNMQWYQHETIGADKASFPHPINEEFLLQKAASGTNQLLKELWKLPMEKTDVGMMAKLPTEIKEYKLPRSLPPPPPKQLTKWEQFALQRGISPKSKQSRKVFDEATGEWKHLTGSLKNKANAGPESWPIIEVKKNDDPFADPWQKLREEKKERVTKNVESRMRNAERRGELEKGSANRMVKNGKKQVVKVKNQREAMREKDRKKGILAPVGVPIDMKSSNDDIAAMQKRGKPSTQLALRATQVSTASLGKFDMMREGEPEKQFHKSINGKKRKLDNSNGEVGHTDNRYLVSETQKSKDILQKVMSGSKEKDRDMKKGKYAKGETAYDHEFDDGLGAGSFKKKKGRAGMGKMKKVTKKRIK